MEVEVEVAQPLLLVAVKPYRFLGSVWVLEKVGILVLMLAVTRVEKKKKKKKKKKEMMIVIDAVVVLFRVLAILLIIVRSS